MKAELSIEIPNYSFSNDPISLLDNIAGSLKKSTIKRDNFWAYSGLLRKEPVERGQRQGEIFGTIKLVLKPSNTDHGSRSATLFWHDMEFEEL
jgi:hypothetical protein